MKPFVKWAGGKRQILSKITKFIDEAKAENDLSDFTYIEPFLGGGAVFFSVQPKSAIVNDLNEDLMNAYRVIKSDDYLELINKLKAHDARYRENPDEYYYDVRGQDRQAGYKQMSDVDRAARMIFLNRTCYNGLYRVNSSGYFNTPIGRYKNPLICDAENLEEIHEYLNLKENDIQIMSGSYEDAFAKAKDGDIIYVDPPYDYEDDDGFTQYQLSGFSFDDFKKLKFVCDEAIYKGCTVIISNNSTEKVLELFKQDPQYDIFYDYEEFKTLRSINCKATDRRSGKEVIIVGMSIDVPQANSIETIIKLASMCCEDGYLNKMEQIRQDLNLGTYRQVAYYLSALVFLKYLNRNKEPVERLKCLNGEKSKIEKDIFEQLECHPLFKDVFAECSKNGCPADIDRCKEIVIQGTKKTLSESTICRRASTIKKWIEWMLQYAKNI